MSLSSTNVSEFYQIQDGFALFKSIIFRKKNSEENISKEISKKNFDRKEIEKKIKRKKNKENFFFIKYLKKKKLKKIFKRKK